VVVANGYRVEIVWHRRETSRQTEKINLRLKYLKKSVYLTHLTARIEVTPREKPGFVFSRNRTTFREFLRQNHERRSSA
jgi:hypothetical protein